MVPSGDWGGNFNGQVIVSSEGSGKLRAIGTSGVPTTLQSNGVDLVIPEAEEVSFVPSDLDPSNPLQGFYGANFTSPIQGGTGTVLVAGGKQFYNPPIDDRGDLIVTSETFPNGPVYDVHWVGTAKNNFSVTQIGNFPYQPEDGIFVTDAIIHPKGCGRIVGNKFSDENCDGLRDGSDYGLSGWTMNLNGPFGYSATTTTDNNGNFHFSSIPFGNYTINETTRPDWIERALGSIGGQYPVVVDSAFCQQDSAYFAFGNSLCEDTPYCNPLKPCLSSWFPFDDGANSPTAADVAGSGYELTFAGSPPQYRWTQDQCGRGAADLSASSPPRYLSEPDYPQEDFGAGSFSIFAWVKMNSFTQFGVRTLVDHRSSLMFWCPNGTSSWAGYWLFMENGKLYVQLKQGGCNLYQQYDSKNLTVPVNQWCHVGVTACRGGIGGLDTLNVWVNGQYAQYTGTSMEGDLTNWGLFQVGEQCPAFNPGTSFDGAVDELQIYKCCLSNSEVAALYGHPCDPCREYVYVPPIVTNDAGWFGNLPNAPADGAFRICNDTFQPVTYNWTIAGLPKSPGGSPCTVDGPTVFSQYAGTVYVGAYQCATIPITFYYPAGFTEFDAGCYQVTVKNMTTMKCLSGQGTLREGPIWVPCCQLVPATLSAEVPVRFRVHNPSNVTEQLPVELTAVSSSGDQSDPVVSLNGLTPGTPWTSVLTLAPGDSAIVQATAKFTEFQGLYPTDVVLSVDWDHSGRYVPSASQGLECVTGEDKHPADERSAPPSLLAPSTSLTAGPNPFLDQTGIHFSLGASQGLVRIGVFDVGGRLVRDIFSGPLEAGSHQYQWDGRDGQGMRSPIGIYFIRVQTPRSLLTTKIVRVE